MSKELWRVVLVVLAVWLYERYSTKHGMPVDWTAFVLGGAVFELGWWAVKGL